jgi:hypothetical protein
VQGAGSGAAGLGTELEVLCADRLADSDLAVRGLGLGGIEGDSGDQQSAGDSSGT